MTDFAFQSASELAQALRAGEISSLELTNYFIARIEKFDGEVIDDPRPAEEPKRSGWR